MWKTYSVSFWEHERQSGTYTKGKLEITPILNDCLGNSITRKVKARTEQEAVKKVKARRLKDHGGRNRNFRLRKCEIVVE
jgi:C4-type Zn-finger protein